MTVAITDEITEAELVEEYTREDFAADVGEVRTFAERLADAEGSIRALVESRESLLVAAALYRVRNLGEHYWKPAGGKATDEALRQWLGTIGVQFSHPRISELLAVGEATWRLRQGIVGMPTIPAPRSARQIQELGRKAIRQAAVDHPKVIPQLWLAANDRAAELRQIAERDGDPLPPAEPTAKVVAEVVANYLANVKRSKPGAPKDKAGEKLAADLRAIRKQLGRLHGKAPLTVSLFIVELYNALVADPIGAEHVTEGLIRECYPT